MIGLYTVTVQLHCLITTLQIFAPIAFEEIVIFRGKTVSINFFLFFLNGLNGLPNTQIDISNIKN